MNTLDYEQQNNLIRYPFRDAASLAWTSGLLSGTFPNSIITDATLTIEDGTVGTLKLYQVIYTGTTWTFQFNGFTEINVSTLSTDVGTVTYTGRSADTLKLLKLAINLDELRIYFSDTLPANAYAMDDDSNSLCLSCYRIAKPLVTTVNFLNSLSRPGYTVEAEVTSGGIALAEGYNVSLAALDNGVSLAVLRNAGLGLYDSCPSIDENVYTINGKSPNNQGNIQLNTDTCLSFVAAEHSLHAVNICRPNCDSPDIINYANYNNRVTHAATQLHALLTDLKNSENGYIALLNSYYARENAKLAPTNPYLIAHINVQSNAADRYYNTTIGIYNPGAGTGRATVTIVKDASDLIAMPNSCYFAYQDDRTLLPNLVWAGNEAVLLSDQSLECGSISYAGYVVRQPVANHTGAQDIHIKLTSSSGSYNGLVSGSLMALAANSLNYNVSYTNDVRNGRRYIRVTVNMFDPANSTSLLSWLNINYAGGLQLEHSVLTKSGVAQNVLANGFTNQVINYSKTNKYELLVSTTALDTTPYTFTITLNNTTLSRVKAVTV